LPAFRVLVVLSHHPPTPPDKIQLQAILNHVEKQSGFVYDEIRFSEDRSKWARVFEKTSEMSDRPASVWGSKERAPVWSLGWFVRTRAYDL